MIVVSSNDGLLNRAFNLASFIVGEREAALRVVREALGKLQVAVSAQGKRLYYRPIGRGWSRKVSSKHSRNNIAFSETHLLQRLIYLESEPYEIALEQGKSSTFAAEEDLVIHFVKHLTKKTIKRNSFYVTLGLSRLLHNYTTAETMEIYNAVIQDPDRVKDDYYYRSRKGVLVQELNQRFGDLIKVCRGPRGEERFQPDDNQHRFVELVRECLGYFTPWQTPCLVPAGIDPIIDGIPSFTAINENDEDKVEVHRIHAVLHPRCFQRLTGNLRLDAPEDRLQIPRFFYANETNGNGSNSNRRNQRELDERELRSITSSLNSNAARRKAASAAVLRIMVDGVERARIDLDKTTSTRFGLDSNAELLEVCSRDKAGEELLLASHLLTDADDNGLHAVDASIILEGGQKISIHTLPQLSDAGAAVEITYRETSPFRAVSLLFRQLTGVRAGGQLSQTIWNGRRVVVPVFTVVLFAIAALAIIKYARHGNPPATDQGHVAANQRTDAQIGTEIPPTGNAATDSRSKPSNQAGNSRQQPQGVGESTQAGNLARHSVQPQADTKTETATDTALDTRSVKKLRTVPLSAVRTVYLDMVGGDAISVQGLRESLSEKISSSGLIKLVSNRDEADALLEVSVSKQVGAGPEAIRVVVQLRDARGKTIWPNATSNGTYHGSALGVSSSISRNLLAAIQSTQQPK
ncbi:MAG TPA: hypothetical protein VIG25_08905 [Pyrinomonadaceae bacterium]